MFLKKQFEFFNGRCFEIFIFRKNKKKKKNLNNAAYVQTRPKKFCDFTEAFGFDISTGSKNHLYQKIRSYIPIIDAAFEKIEKITGSFKFKCKTKEAENFLNEFALKVKVGHSLTGLNSFLQIYLDSLLMYGNAIGEIVLDKNYNIKALYNANINDIFLNLAKDFVFSFKP